MKFKTTQQRETEIEIPIPSYYKNPDTYGGSNHMVGILNKNTVCVVYDSKNRTHVSNDDLQLSKGELVTAFLNWTEITEDEFLVVYDRALSSMSLTPQLVKGELT